MQAVQPVVNSTVYNAPISNNKLTEIVCLANSITVFSVLLLLSNSRTGRDNRFL